MQGAIYEFTAEELHALHESRFFIVKDSAIKKIIQGFENLRNELLALTPVNYEGLELSTGKIFRGENYRLHPYVVLDYPKLFNTKTVFAFRSMLWWGHEFSFTLHLQGDAFKNFQDALIRNRNELLNKNIYCCVNENPWQYHFGKDNYLPLDETDALKAINETKDFIKLSRKLSLEEYSGVSEFGTETFRLFMNALK